MLIFQCIKVTKGLLLNWPCQRPETILCAGLTFYLPRQRIIETKCSSCQNWKEVGMIRLQSWRGWRLKDRVRNTLGIPSPAQVISGPADLSPGGYPTFKSLVMCFFMVGVSLWCLPSCFHWLWSPWRKRPPARHGVNSQYISARCLNFDWLRRRHTGKEGSWDSLCIFVIL